MFGNEKIYINDYQSFECSIQYLQCGGQDNCRSSNIQVKYTRPVLVIGVGLINYCIINSANSFQHSMSSNSAKVTKADNWVETKAWYLRSVSASPSSAFPSSSSSPATGQLSHSERKGKTEQFYLRSLYNKPYQRTQTLIYKDGSLEDESFKLSENISCYTKPRNFNQVILIIY